MNKTVPEELRAKAALYEERNKLYGDNYKLFGPAVMLMFPNGITLETPDDMSRFGVLVQILAKITRYCNMFNRGGHDDSLDDISVYSMMLKELDIEARADPIELPGLLTEEDIAEVTKDFHPQDGTLVVGGEAEPPLKPTHYVHSNGSTTFVKEARFFLEQNGHIEPWGKKWRPVVASSIAEARDIGRNMDWRN